MRGRPERILLFRSGRHLQTALAALRADAPGCDITIVATPAAAAVLDQIGVDSDHRIMYGRTPFFRPWPFVASGTWARAVARRFDRVCVLWNDQEGSGAANVDHTAALVSPRGFTAITPDGALVAQDTASILVRECRRAMASIGVAAFLGFCVFLPARLLRPFRS